MVADEVSLKMPLRIGIRDHFPISTKCALDPICPDRGLLFNALKEVCYTWNLNCSFSFHELNGYGTVYPNGTSTGLLELIRQRELDTILPVIPPSHHRLEVMQFS